MIQFPTKLTKRNPIRPKSRWIRLGRFGSSWQMLSERCQKINLVGSWDPLINFRGFHAQKKRRSCGKLQKSTAFIRWCLNGCKVLSESQKIHTLLRSNYKMFITIGKTSSFSDCHNIALKPRQSFNGKAFKTQFFLTPGVFKWTSSSISQQTFSTRSQKAQTKKVPFER